MDTVAPVGWRPHSLFASVAPGILALKKRPQLGAKQDLFDGRRQLRLDEARMGRLGADRGWLFTLERHTRKTQARELFVPSSLWDLFDWLAGKTRWQCPLQRFRAWPSGQLVEKACE